jgi:hypothetical protein
MMKSMCIRAVLQWQLAFLRFLSRYPWVVHVRLMQSLDLGLLWRSKSFVSRCLLAIFCINFVLVGMVYRPRMTSLIYGRQWTS